MKKNILECIGRTPIVKLNRVVPQDSKDQFFAKVEFTNPGGSIKDRIALSIVERAEERGDLKPGGTIVEATSGNTGSGLALVAAVKGYKAIFCMPEKISEEKRAILRAYGAQVVMTPNGLEPDDPRSFYSVAKRLSQLIPNSLYTNQYHNPDNVTAHYEGTGPEIWEQMEHKVDVVVAGAGTGGTLSGVGRYLKEKNPNVKMVMADPVGSLLYDLYYHGEVRDKVHSYLVEGIGEDMLPSNVHFKYLDAVVKTEDPEAFQLSRQIAAEEGILVGPSTGSILAAAKKYVAANPSPTPRNIVLIFPDSGKSYLSKAFNVDYLIQNKLIERSSLTEKLGGLIEQHSSSVPSLQASDPLQKAIEVFVDTGAPELAVLDEGKVAGFVRSSSLFQRLSLRLLSKTDILMRALDGAILEMDPDQTLAEAEHMLQVSPILSLKGQKSLKLFTHRDLLQVFKA